MSLTPNTSATPAQRFGLIIRRLLFSVGARATQNLLTGGYPGAGMARLPWPMAELISARFRRASRLFAGLAERVRLGTVLTFPNRASPRSKPSPDVHPGGQPASALPTPAARNPAAPKMPRGFGGVLRLLHWEAAECADLLRRELSDREMVALLRSAPGFARIVRPLCRMLAVVPPPGLFAPPPRRSRGGPQRVDAAAAPPQRVVRPQRARTFGDGQDRPGLLTRPRPAAWERRLETRLAASVRKSS